jgi:hypothetical protein
MNRPVSFALHIAPLFTPAQRDCMLPKFDLASYDAVKAKCTAIHDRLANGSMPADDSAPWPDEWVALLARWIAEGCAS